MGLDLEKKNRIISKMHEVMEVALSSVVASLEGIKANEIVHLRSMCRESNVYVYVVRNSLMCRSFEHTVFECLQKIFIGSNIIAFSTVEASDCIKVFAKFAKNHPKFKIKGAVFDGVFIEESKVSALSSLPSYKDSIAHLMFVILESCVGRLIRLLYEFYKCRKN